jgi:hypothetical protein
MRRNSQETLLLQIRLFGFPLLSCGFTLLQHLVEEGLASFPEELAFHFVEFLLSEVVDFAVFLFDLLSGLLGEVAFEEGEVGSEADQQLQSAWTYIAEQVLLLRAPLFAVSALVAGSVAGLSALLTLHLNLANQVFDFKLHQQYYIPAVNPNWKSENIRHIISAVDKVIH